MNRQSFSAWLQEPLLHFLLAGGLLFVVYAWFNEDGSPKTVRITSADVNWLKETWTRQWQRPPDEQEVRDLVNGYLREVLLAREAQELGLSENDTVIRRRLAQKMAFLVQDTARLAEPDEATLRRIYAADYAHYRTPLRISFTQIYFRSEADAVQGLKKLGKNTTAEVGDPILLERDYAALDEPAVTSLFGRAFAAKIIALEPHRWQGPISSAYGFHLVLVSERQPAQPRPFEAVRAQVRDAWQLTQQAKANQQFFAGLLQKYQVVVEAGVEPQVGTTEEGNDD
ncbi:MAG: peptidylprolyl isomerase [Gammaproteobacteria bacterium]